MKDTTSHIHEIQWNPPKNKYKENHIQAQLCKTTEN